MWLEEWVVVVLLLLPAQDEYGGLRRYMRSIGRGGECRCISLAWLWRV